MTATRLPAEISSHAPPRTGAATRARTILVASLNPHPGFIDGIARYAREHDWRLVTDMIHTGVMPARWDGDGILAFASYQSDVAHFIAGAAMPCVTLSLTDACDALPRIQPDQKAIGQLAARHLLERGCSEFVWAPFNDDAQNRERLDGFRHELQLHGCDCHLLPPAHRRIGHAWHDNGAEWLHAVHEWLKSRRGLAGLFAFNDCLAARLAAVARDRSVEIPHDLALVGVGNDLLECETGPVSLSSIDLDIEGLAYRSAEVLCQVLSGRPPAIQLLSVAPRRVVERESTHVRGPESSRIQQAINHVLLHCTDPHLGVAGLAEAVGISRRQLERDFRNLKGCTVRAFIETTRMERASRLLLDHPHTKVLSIAESIGITDPNSFYRKFRKQFGVTPAAFRRQQLGTPHSPMTSVR